MDAERCMYCRKIIPEGRMICPMCEYKLTKLGAILQNKNMTEEEIQEAYDSLYDDIEKEDEYG